MFEVLTLGENPYFQYERNADYKERMKMEYEWVIENWTVDLQKQFICRKYRTTKNKQCEGEILRCGEPDNIPDFRVTRESFEKVMKVCQQKKTLSNFWAGNEKLLGYWANGSAQIQTISEQSWKPREWPWLWCQSINNFCILWTSVQNTTKTSLFKQAHKAR